MFGFGGLSEVLFILFVAMLIFGPAKMPEIARMLAKGLAEVRKASNELKRTLNAELAISEQEKEAARLQAAAPFPPPPPPAPAAWSGGETVPQLAVPGASVAATPASSEAAGVSEAAGNGEAAESSGPAGGSEAAAGSGEAAAGGSEDAASHAGPAGSAVSPSGDDAALTTDAAYYAAWPEDGSSPHAAADPASAERAATTATIAPDGRHSA
jgi:sec-independent protein translocase protein TatB